MTIAFCLRRSFLDGSNTLVVDELKHLGILFEKQSGLSALDVEVMLSIFVMRQSDFFRCFCLIAFSYMISGTVQILPT